jgi:hypothetical protein
MKKRYPELKQLLDFVDHGRGRLKLGLHGDKSMAAME